MSRHLLEDELLEILELGDEPAPGARAHVASCAHCRARLDEAREGLALARLADIPEPSSLFWGAFQRGVQRRITRGGGAVRRWRIGPLLAAAAAAAALVAVAPPPPGPGAVEPATLAAWSALPQADEDLGLAVLAALSPTAEEVGPVAECGLAHCLVELSDEESLSLAEALREELEGRVL